MLKRQLSIKSICFSILFPLKMLSLLIAHDYDERSNRVLFYKKLHIQDKAGFKAFNVDLFIYFTRRSETFLFYSLLSYFRPKKNNKRRRKRKNKKRNKMLQLGIKQLDVPNLSLLPLVIYH